MRQKLNALAVALVAGALLGPALPDAQAQSADRHAERRAERERREKGGAEETAQENRYPEAKRESPEASASARLAPKLEELFAAYEAGDTAKTEALATEVVGNPRANAYEKSLAQRMVGAVYANEDPEKALPFFEQAIAGNGLGNNDHYDTLFIVAQLHLQAQRYDRALATVDELLADSGSKDPQHLALKGNALYRMERYPEAIALLKPVVDADPQVDSAVQQILMASYAESGQAAEAAALGERVAAATPQDKTAQMNLAVTYLQSGQHDRAAEIYEKLRASGQLTDDRDYRNLFAVYANGEGKEAQALAVINEGIEKGVVKPDHKLHSAIGQMYYYADQPDQAIDAYRKAAASAPDGEAALNLAKILAAEGRDADSKQAAQQALDKGVAKPEEAKQLLAR